MKIIGLMIWAVIHIHTIIIFKVQILCFLANSAFSYIANNLQFITGNSQLKSRSVLIRYPSSTNMVGHLRSSCSDEVGLSCWIPEYLITVSRVQMCCCQCFEKRQWFKWIRLIIHVCFAPPHVSSPPRTKPLLAQCIFQIRHVPQSNKSSSSHINF